MSCPHSLKSGPCSQCIQDATVRRVSQDATTIDGEPSGRGLDPLAHKPNTYYARRGGIAKGRKTHP